MSKLDIVDISYACAVVRICLACVFVQVRMCVRVCVRVHAFIYHEMCVNSSKKANLYEIVYLVKNAFLQFTEFCRIICKWKLNNSYTLSSHIIRLVKNYKWNQSNTSHEPLSGIIHLLNIFMSILIFIFSFYGRRLSKIYT